MDSGKQAAFCERVWEFYRGYGRDLPWRDEPSAYGVFVSEVMLQQTQVSRVLGAYPAFLQRFAGFEALAGASVADVLAQWQGMGYNRRALWLRAAAQMVVSEYGGVLPRDPAVLVRLPGVGANTAGSIAAFAHNVPAMFIETNIRRVFIHEFFGESLGSDTPPGERTPSVSSRGPVSEPTLAGGRVSSTLAVSDGQLRPLIEATLDREHPREWYWALMDYGADLAKRVPNPNRRSKHYAVQSAFEGSVRQLRGEVLRQLLAGPKAVGELRIRDERLPAVLGALVKEGFVIWDGTAFSLTK